MEKTDPGSHQDVGEGSAGQGKELNLLRVEPAETEDTHWLRMDPSVTQAVLAKTEQELLGSLAALMRNKIEHEQVARRITEAHAETEQTRQELEEVRAQVRSAEEEVATRLNEQSRINDEIVRVRSELQNLHLEHSRKTELISDLNALADQKRVELEAAKASLGAVKEATGALVARHDEISTQLSQTHIEKQALEHSLISLREEVDGRIRAREALIEETTILHGHVSDLSRTKTQHDAELAALRDEHSGLRDKVKQLLSEHAALLKQVESLRDTATQHAGLSDRLKAGLDGLHAEIAERTQEQRLLQQSLAEEQTRVHTLLTTKGNLEQSILEADARHRDLQAGVDALVFRLQEFTAGAKNTIEAAHSGGRLPLLFETRQKEVSPEWDPYPLESEFHTDERLDADKVAELVTGLPGLEGCMLVRNRGAVLASQFPERLHGFLSVPERNYELLFDQLQGKLEDCQTEKGRFATFQLGEDGLSIARSEHTFLFASHKQLGLRPGVAGKLTSIVAEVAKMYP